MTTYNKLYYKNNREELKAYSKIYYNENKEKLKAYQKNYYKINKKKWDNYRKTYQQEYILNDGKTINYWNMYYKLNKQRYKGYYQANKEKRKEYSKNYYLTKQKKTITQKYADMIISDRYNNMLKTISIPIPKTEINQEVRILEFN
jgi:hypothetical protein